jgi:hypothetical protein
MSDIKIIDRYEVRFEPSGKCFAREINTEEWYEVKEGQSLNGIGRDKNNERNVSQG